MVNGHSNQQIFNAFIQTVAGILREQDPQRLEHGIRSGMIARDFLASENDPKADHMFFVGLLHVIGEDISLGRPDQTKDIVLDEHAKLHTDYCSEIVSSIPGLESVGQAIRDYRENLDGTGFPHKKKGTQINYYSQILKLAEGLELVHTSRTKLNALQANSAFLQQMHHKVEVKLDLTFMRTFDDAYMKAWRELDVVAHLESTLKATSLPELSVIGIDAFGKFAAALGKIIDFQCGYSFGHSERVMSLGVMIGRQMGLEHDALTELKWAALIHDTGKLLVPNEILAKQSGLSSEEHELIRHLPQKSAEAISPLVEIADLTKIIHTHKEHMDGKGYPSGLQDNAIPLIARIINVADSFDAMTHRRPYGSSMNENEVLSAIKKDAGIVFDKSVVAALEKVLTERAA